MTPWLIVHLSPHRLEVLQFLLCSEPELSLLRQRRGSSWCWSVSRLLLIILLVLVQDQEQLGQVQLGQVRDQEQLGQVQLGLKLTSLSALD